jgi:hypothetical protein
MKTSLAASILWLVSLSGHAQVDKLVNLPYSEEITIRDLPVKVTLREFRATTYEAFMKATFSFNSPVTGEPIEFDADEIPINYDGSIRHSFSLQRKRPLSEQEEKYLTDILQWEDGEYRWRCVCHHVTLL